MKQQQQKFCVGVCSHTCAYENWSRKRQALPQSQSVGNSQGNREGRPDYSPHFGFGVMLARFLFFLARLLPIFEMPGLFVE